MNNSLPDIQQLRNNIDFASIAQFFHTFQSAFRPWPTSTNDIIYSRISEPNEYVFETEDLERMILEASERLRLEDLLVRMLRLLTRLRFINASNWQTYFSKEFDKREYDQINPFRKDELEEKKELVNYFSMPLDTKVHLLHLLCEWQLEEPDKFREQLDSEDDSVQWRVDPIGFDRKGSTFWLFDDNRLYKETPKPKPTKKPTNKKRAPAARRSSRKSARLGAIEDEQVQGESEDEGEWMPWKLLCATKQEWEQFPLKYANSNHIDEQRFYQLLVQDLLPKILPALDEHEKEIKRQEALIHRKRSSRIMIKELESLEQPSSRISNRIEKKAQEKEQQEKERLARAREERLLERERRIMEREYRILAKEKSQPAEEPIAVEKVAEKTEDEEPKPKRKYTKRPKFDEHGNPIPRKPKLDKDGNVIPLKKRGRKPKNRDPIEESWVFECVCGVSGKNLDDGTPMVACEKCSIWQHIKCLQKSGQVEKAKSMDNVSFVCQKCEKKQDNTVNEAHQYKKQKIDDYNGASNDIDSHHLLPPTQSTWQPQHPSLAVRGDQQPMAAIPTVQKHAYYPPSVSVLPPIRAPIPLPPQQHSYYPTPSYPQIRAMPNYSPTLGASASMIYQQQQSNSISPVNANTGQPNVTSPSAVQAQYQPSTTLPNAVSLPPIKPMPMKIDGPHQPPIQFTASQSTSTQEKNTQT